MDIVRTLAELDAARREYESAVASTEKNSRFSESYKASLLSEHAAKFEKTREVRDAALSDVEAQMRDAEKQEAALRSQFTLTPKDVGQWQEAAARSGFVREDVEAANVGEIAKSFRSLAAGGDRVGGWLYARYGVQRLSADAASRKEYRELQSSVSDVESPDAATSAKLEALKSKRVAAFGACEKLRQHQTPSEKLAQANELHKRFPSL